MGSIKEALVTFSAIIIAGYLFGNLIGYLIFSIVKKVRETKSIIFFCLIRGDNDREAIRIYRREYAKKATRAEIHEDLLNWAIKEKEGVPALIKSKTAIIVDLKIIE